MKLTLLLLCIYLQINAHCPVSSYKLHFYDYKKPFEVSKEFYDKYQELLVDTKLTVSVFDSQDTSNPVTRNTLAVFNRMRNNLSYNSLSYIFTSYMSLEGKVYFAPCFNLKFVKTENEFIETSKALFAYVLDTFISTNVRCIMYSNYFGKHEKTAVIAIPTDSMIQGLAPDWSNRIYVTIIRAVLRWKYYMNLEGKSITHEIIFMLETDRKEFFENLIKELDPIVRQEVGRIHPTNAYPTEPKDQMIGHILLRSTFVTMDEFTRIDADALVLTSAAAVHAIRNQKLCDIEKNVLDSLASQAPVGKAIIFPKLKAIEKSDLRYLIRAFTPDFKQGNFEENLRLLKLSLGNAICCTGDGFIGDLAILFTYFEDLNDGQKNQIYEAIVDSVTSYITEFYHSYNHLRSIVFFVPHYKIASTLETLIKRKIRNLQPEIRNFETQRDVIDKETLGGVLMTATVRDKFEIKFPFFNA